jgi:Fe-S cluster assembly protein SufD
MSMARATLDRYLSEFERLDVRWQSGSPPSWLRSTRREAMDRFQTLGFPTTSEEEWRFTNVAPIAETTFDLPSGSATRLMPNVSPVPFTFNGSVAAELVFVDGEYAPELSSVPILPAGVRVGRLASVLEEDPEAAEPFLGRIAGFERNAFTAWNTAFLRDGAFVSVAPDAILPAPIHVLFVSSDFVEGPSESGSDSERTGRMAHPRVLVVAGRSSHVRIVESYIGLGGGRPYLTNAITEIMADENARVDHWSVVRESGQAYHTGGIHIRTCRNASVRAHSVTLEGALVRNEVIARLDGEGGECQLDGLYLAQGSSVVDNHTTIDHAQPHCSSRELYKGILTDTARAVFNGKIIVRPDAQKTDAKQTNKALLLSEDAQINTKPQLEIFANDVKCTHGAAVGQMDEEAIFYLRARGLSHRQARQLLVEAFARDVLGRMQFEPLERRVDTALGRHLAGML